MVIIFGRFVECTHSCCWSNTALFVICSCCWQIEYTLQYYYGEQVDENASNESAFRQMANNSEKWQMEFHPVYPWQHKISLFVLEAVIWRVFGFCVAAVRLWKAQARKCHLGKGGFLLFSLLIWYWWSTKRANSQKKDHVYKKLTMVTSALVALCLSLEQSSFFWHPGAIILTMMMNHFISADGLTFK